jgi:membrane-bound lytic murein transglycosylase D
VRVAQPSKPKPATPKTKTYTVKKGDTLSGIAKKLGISMATLKKLNPVYWTNPKYDHGNKIWSGDKVKYA